ncbi:MAG: MFS transporter [Sulfurimonas sp.]
MREIDKNIIAIGWVSFFTDMASAMITTLLPVFVVYVLDESVDKLGYIIALATFVSYLLRILFGYLSDKYQRVKPFLVFGYLLSALTKPLIGFSHSYESVALLRALERVGKAVRSAPKDALISAYSKKNKEGKSFGFHKMMDVSGEMLGSVIIVFIFAYSSMQDEMLIREVFYWTLLPGLVAVGVVVFFVKDISKKDRVKKETKIDINRDDYRLFWILGSYFLFLLFFMSDQYFLLRAKELGFTLAQLPLLAIVATLTQALLSYYSGALIDRFGAKFLLFLSYLFALLSLVFMHYDFIWLGFVGLGAFTVVSLNAMRSYISKNARSQGFIYGVFYAGVAFATAIGAVVIGKLWTVFGFESAFLFSFFGSLCVSLLLLVKLLREALKTSDIK